MGAGKKSHARPLKPRFDHRKNRPLKQKKHPDTGHWEHLRSEPGMDMTIFRTRFNWMRNPRNGKEVRVTLAESADSVNGMVLTTDRQVVLTRQFRFGISQHILEVPGGLIEAGESPQTAMARELREETGFTAATFHYLGKVAANPVFMNSYVHHFLALDAHATHALALDDAEDITVVCYPLDEVWTMVRNGIFVHPHSFSALVRAFWKLEELGIEWRNMPRQTTKNPAKH